MNKNYPNPKLWIRLTDNRHDDKHRYQDCKHYDSCLDFAAESHWPSFTCWFCSLNPRRWKEVEDDRKENAY